MITKYDLAPAARSNAEAYRAYLRGHPDGMYVTLTRGQLEAICRDLADYADLYDDARGWAQQATANAAEIARLRGTLAKSQERLHAVMGDGMVSVEMYDALHTENVRLRAALVVLRDRLPQECLDDFCDWQRDTIAAALGAQETPQDALTAFQKARGDAFAWEIARLGKITKAARAVVDAQNYLSSAAVDDAIDDLEAALAECPQDATYASQGCDGGNMGNGQPERTVEGRSGAVDAKEAACDER
jgi:hypothetical protein